jgi:hypothetical protein
MSTARRSTTIQHFSTPWRKAATAFGSSIGFAGEAGQFQSNEEEIQMSRNIDEARSYVESVGLPAAPPSMFGVDEAVQPIFDKTKAQAVVVGSDVISFVSGIDAKTRAAISDCSLLAQLVAKKKVGDPQKIYDWYAAYFDVLSNIGWVIQEQGFSEYAASGEGLQVHEAILKVATVALGAAPTALALVTTALNSLKSMNEGSPWITIFNRETQRAKAAKFQVTLVRKDENDGLLVELMAFGMEAKQTITQVLFFKVKKNKAKLRHNIGKASINEPSLEALGPDIRGRVLAFQKAYIASLGDL